MPETEWMKVLIFKLDFLVLALVIAGFVFVAAQRLGTVPVPEGDEAFTLQVPYELLNRGKLALPMLRYLGGNIENAWHSFTPIYFLMLSGFLKVFGFGLAQGRAFNLLTAVATLVMVYLICRRLFDWRAGMAAVIMLIGDQTFLERSRLLRNDYAAEAFALLAFLLYEVAESRKSWRLYIASGLAAGAAVMCHTNALCMLFAICLLFILKEGLRALSSKRFSLFAGSAFAVMAYELIYDIIDYKNFLLQNRGDDLHFRVLSAWGFWQNLLEERLRYQRWLAGGTMFPGLPQTTLRIFQLLTVAAFVYLVILAAQQIRRGYPADPRVRTLAVIAVVVLFHALIVSHKRIYYIAHIATWFAIAVGILISDALRYIERLRQARGKFTVAIVLLVIAAIAYCSQLVRQNVIYIVEVRRSDLASFDEFTAVIRGLIPEELCPVAVKNPSIWLAFPEKDHCFATIESRIKDEALADISGKNYALVTRPNALAQLNADSNDQHGGFHLLGEMRDTPYGNLLIYYTGSDTRLLALTPKHYQFFGNKRGYEMIWQATKD
jgi:4-amino-4-deoxy-L-arabinose transferase-like glycosyltransferase